MKKTIMSLALMSAVASVSAADFGLGYSRDTTNNVNGLGLSVTENWNKVSLTAAINQFDVAVGEQSQYSLIAGYQFAKLAGVAVEAQFGATYIVSDIAKDGLTNVVGLGASMPVYQKISVTADVQRHIGTGSMKVHDGTTVGVGLKYSF